MRRFAVLTLLLASPAAAQTGPQIYSLVQAQSAVLFQWNVAAGQLSGSAQVVNVNPDLNGINLTVTNATLTGTSTGSSVALALSRVLIAPGVTALSGSLSPKTLSLQYPLSTGGFGSLTLNTTTLSAFTQDVEKLKAAATKTVNTLRQQDAQSKAAEAQARLLGEVDFVLADLERLTDELNQAAPALTASIAVAQTGLQAGEAAVVRAADAAKRCEGFTEALAQGEALLAEVRLTAETLRTERQFVSELQLSLEGNLTAHSNALKALQGRVPATEIQRLTAAATVSLASANRALNTAKPVLEAAEQQAQTNQTNVAVLFGTLRGLHC